jgi:peptidoglycan/xylan/chitin deacetylase (PgdA/CDA1 family)
MTTMYFCATVDDVGLEGYSTPQHLEKLLRFWDENNLKGTLFTVPRCNGKEIGEIKDYVDLLTNAVATGHEVAQHGLDHTRFQTGIPPKIILDLPHEGPARQYLADHRKEIEASLSVQRIRETLSAGRGILESALGIKVRGFRAPCGSICDNLFAALDEEGYRYDSSRIFQEAAWHLISNPDKPVTPLPINRSRLEGFQLCRSTHVLPIVAEYTWYLKREYYPNFLRLAKHDFDACLAGSIPFVPVCHVSPIEQGDPDCGFAFYRELIRYAREQADKHGVTLVGATMADVAKQWNSFIENTHEQS